MLFIGLSLTTGLIVLAAMLPISHCSHWIVRGLDFPRFQLAVIGAATAVICILGLDFSQPQSWLLVLLNMAATLYQLWWIAPYTPCWPKQVKRTAPHSKHALVRILSSNVLMPNKNADALIDIIKARNPDIVVTLESNQWWEDQIKTIEAQYPHTIKCPKENLYGMHVYSKHALHDGSVKYLIDDDIPSIEASITLANNRSVRLHFLHPTPPSPTESETSQDRDSELILVAKKLANFHDPVIVTGDLNDVAWSKTTRLFRHQSGLKDPRIGRGMFNTFHAGYWFLRWPLDHLFHSDHFQLKTMARIKLKGSDHFALFTELSLANDSNKTTTDTQPDALSDDEKSLMRQRKQEQQAKATNNHNG